MSAWERRDRVLAVARGEIAPERLESVLTPEGLLGNASGVTVTLTRVELWTWHLLLRFEAMQNELTAELDSAFAAEFAEFEQRWADYRDGVTREEHAPPPPEEPSVPHLSELPLAVSDDLGTRYEVYGKATGGDHAWRSEWKLEPAVPPAARMLSVALTGGARLDLDLPSRA